MKSLYLFLTILMVSLISTKVAVGSTSNSAALKLADRIEVEIASAVPEQNSAAVRYGNDPKAQEAFLAQIQARHDQEVRSFNQSIKRLKAFLEQSNFESAKDSIREMERRINALNPPEGTIELISELKDEIAKLENAYQLEWYRLIEEKVVETREKCLAAERAAELDGLTSVQLRTV